MAVVFAAIWIDSVRDAFDAILRSKGRIAFHLETAWRYFAIGLVGVMNEIVASFFGSDKGSVFVWMIALSIVARVAVIGTTIRFDG